MTDNIVIFSEVILEGYGHTDKDIFAEKKTAIYKTACMELVDRELMSVEIIDLNPGEEPKHYRIRTEIKT